MRKPLTMTWRASVALIGLAATALFVGTPTASAQGPYTETVAMPAGAIGMPSGGAVQINGPDHGPSLNAVHVEGGGMGHSTVGGYAVPVGPACTVGVVGGAPGYGQVSDAACGIGGGFAQPVEGGLIEAHYP